MAPTFLNFQGQVPYAVQDALDKLIAWAQVLEQENAALKQRLAALPAPLTLAQIQQGLSASGSNPLNLHGLPT